MKSVLQLLFAFRTAASVGHKALSTRIDPWIRTRCKYPTEYLGRCRNGQGERDEHPICSAAGADSRSLQMNRVASLHLTERCEEILVSIRGKIADTGDTVAEELHAPIVKLVKYAPAALIYPRAVLLICRFTQGVQGSP